MFFLKGPLFSKPTLNLACFDTKCVGLMAGKFVKFGLALIARDPKISGLRFENFLVSNGSRRVRTVSFHSPRRTSFALGCWITVFLVLELGDDFDVDINGIV